MADIQQRESVWKRLTRLFRSGPVIRHKIAAGEKFAEPQGTARAYKKELSSLYVNSLASYGQYERLARYADYSEMEFTPELSAGLNIFADESTSQDENGRTIKIVTKNQEIKQILETLFFEILNIEFNVWSWTRNLCKYGDMVLFVDANEQNGILNLMPIPINEVEREEGYDKEDPFAVRFRWLTQGNRILQNWQVIHFRLLGNDNFLPYGTSMIEAARRIWRQLILIEDAMMVYRIVRSPERRVFYIDVGNIPPANIPTFMEEIKTKLRRTQVVDPTTGRVDLRYNPLSVDEDFFVPTRGDKGSTRIETLPGGQFTGDIEDVQYIQSKLFAALTIPKSYLSFEGDVGSKATLAQQDVRFSRTIERIQKILIAEFNKIAIVHLFLLGYSGADLVDFRIEMANPSTIALQQKLELWRAKFEIAGSATEGILDRDKIYKDIFHFTDEEINQVKEGKKRDKLEDLVLESMQLPADEGGGEGESIPGEDQLPDQLGAEPPAEAPAAPAEEPAKPEEGLIPPGSQTLSEEPSVEKGDANWGVECKSCGKKFPWNSAVNVDAVGCCEKPIIGFMFLDVNEKRNKGSEGNRAEIGGKGHNLFNPGTNLYKHASPGEKQASSDPTDRRFFKRLITRPFSESSDPADKTMAAGELYVESVERFLVELEGALKGQLS